VIAVIITSELEAILVLALDTAHSALPSLSNLMMPETPSNEIARWNMRENYDHSAVGLGVIAVSVLIAGSAWHVD
jgi:hypothetical protein